LIVSLSTKTPPRSQAMLGHGSSVQGEIVVLCLE
jgi:hypothetical protein